jgi:hypothetical protein
MMAVAGSQIEAGGALAPLAIFLMVCVEVTP